MAQRLAAVWETAELNSSVYSVQSLESSCYLHSIRSISAVSAPAEWASGWSSQSARSSNYSSYCSTMSGASGGSSAPVGSRVSTTDPELREIAYQMVSDGYMQDLIGAFGREPGRVLERWFRELDVDWVLGISTKDKWSSPLLLQELVGRWTRALTLMAQALSAAECHLRGERSTGGGIRDEEGALATIKISTSDADVPDGLRLARLAEASISKMLAFADVLAATKHRLPTEKLLGLIHVHFCVTGVSETLVPSLQEESRWLTVSDEMQSLVNQIDDVLSRETDKLGSAIWSMMLDAEGAIFSEKSWEAFPRDGEVHKTTRLIADYVNLFRRYESSLNPIVSRFSASLYKTSVNDVIQDMISGLECQLEENSRWFFDPCQRYVFLLNNSQFMEKVLLSIGSTYWLLFDKKRKVDGYLKSYLDASWEPVLSCLRAGTPLCFPRPPSLAKFESEFRITCSAQKLWKVPNPELRKRLRKAIIDKVIIAGYNKYMEVLQEQKKCTDPPGSSSQDMVDMLNELFEG